MTNKNYESLTEDPLIGRQRFALVSFAQPLNKPLLQRRESFFAKEFISSYLQEREKVLNYDKELTEEMKLYIEKEPKIETVSELYDTFRTVHLNNLDKKFNESDNINDEIISSAYKVRGVYATIEEAKTKALELKKFDKVFDIYLAEVGKWVPYIEGLDKSEEVKYDDEILDKIVNGNVEKSERDNLDFQERKQKLINRIKEEEKQKKNEEITEIVIDESDEEEEKPKKEKKQKKKKPRKMNNRRRRRKNN